MRIDFKVEILKVFSLELHVDTRKGSEDEEGVDLLDVIDSAASASK